MGEGLRGAQKASRNAFWQNEIAGRREGSVEEADDKQCEVLKTQIAVCMQATQAGIFESERRSRETIREEKEKLKRKLEEAQEFIKRLTTELDARNGTSKGGRSGAKMTSIRDENGYMGGRTALPVQETRHV